MAPGTPEVSGGRKPGQSADRLNEHVPGPFAVHAAWRIPSHFVVSSESAGRLALARRPGPTLEPGPW